MKSLWTLKNLLWLVYAAVLVVVAPHTQWMFSRFEPPTNKWISWVAALAFEASIFVAAHLFVRRVERRKASTFNFAKQRLEAGKFSRFFSWWPLFRYRWINIYSALLFTACAISGGANLAHAIEFLQPIKIATDWKIPASAFVVAFGGILPLVHLVLAAILADVDEAEQSADPEFEKAKSDLREANKVIREQEKTIRAAEHRALEAEQQMRGAANFFRCVFDKEMELQERIRLMHLDYPNLSQNRIAGLIGCSVSTVNKVFSEE